MSINECYFGVDKQRKAIDTAKESQHIISNRAALIGAILSACKAESSTGLRDMHRSRLRQACSSGTCLDGLGRSVAVGRVTSRVSRVLSYVLAAFVLPSLCFLGEFEKAEGVGRSGQARRGCVPR